MQTQSIRKEAVMGNHSLVTSNVYHVKEVLNLIIDDDMSIGTFNSFFAADDLCRECEEQGFKVYVESRTAVGPVLTDEDLDLYAEHGPDMGLDPRNGFEEHELPQVLIFLAMAAEFKAIGFRDKAMYAEEFMYEDLIYSYTKIADNVYGMAY